MESILNEVKPELLIETNNLHEEFKESKVLSKYIKEDKLDVNEVAKALINVNGLLGKKLTEVDTDTLKELNSKLGIPNSIEEYDFEAKENLADLGLQVKQAALEAKLDKESAKLLYSKIEEFELAKELKAFEAEKLKIEENKKRLAEEFKDSLDVKLKFANKALDTFGDDSIKEIINNSGLGNNPEFIKFLSTVGEKTSPKEIISEVEKKPAASEADVQSEIKELMRNPAYFNTKHQEHGKIRERVKTLYSAIYG